jgi:GTPase Era involved in 16S rRNA processing
VVDSVKHLDLVTKEAIKRVLAHKFQPSLLRALNRIKSLGAENINIDELMKFAKEIEEGTTKDFDDLNFEPKNLSSILVMNKIDLVENKRKLKTLQEELEDLGAFDKVFHVSCETDFGIEALRNYLLNETKRRPWRYHPDIITSQSDVEKAEQVLKRLLYNRFYKEIPYNTIGYVISWVPMSNGQIKVNFNIEVKHDIHMAMIIGKSARVIKELREELDKELSNLFQMPMKCNLFVVKGKKVQQEILNEKGILRI